MTHLLLEAIRDLLVLETEHTLFPSPLEPGKRIRPHGFIGDLPPKRSRETQGNDFPFILIRGGVGQDELVEGLEKTTINISIVCGIWVPREDSVDQPESGITECQNLVDRCRTILKLNDVVGLKFKLLLPLSWHVQEQTERTLPYYLGAMETIWDAPSISKVLELEDSGYGANEG